MEKRILIEKEVENLTGTRRFACEAVKYFNTGNTILLYGNLGSGKTYLTREFVKLLGSDAEVSSPSFSIINQYNDNIPINHVDLYRIKNKEDLVNLGLDDLWDEDYINFIEWPEIVDFAVTWPHYRLHISSSSKHAEWRKFKLFEYYV